MGDMELDAPAHARPPLNFASFAQAEKLPQARHASGEVWRMRDAAGTECVFKVICVPLTSEDEIEKNLQGVREAWQAASGHPGICTLLGCMYDRPKRSFVIATEWMDALSLGEHMRTDEPIPEQVVGSVAAQVTNALAHLHKVWHRAHRDLKPSNILLNLRGEARVTDLGQSKQLAMTLGQMGTYVGAQVYMSPQRIQGAKYTSACDVWSLGMILQECLLGYFPYREVLRAQGAEGSVDVLIEVIEEGPPPPLTPSFSAEARDFCARALHFSEADRPTSMDLMNHPYAVNSSAQPLAQWLATVSMPRLGRPTPS